MDNSILGIIIFMLGGLAGAVFYLPFKKVTNWAWESYWLVYALFGLVIVPWGLALITCPQTISVIGDAPSTELFRCYIFGAMWGFGGLTWGLMIRYLGVGLGLALGCGICSAAGTLFPPIFKGQLASLTADSAAIVALWGVVVSVIGIILIGGAGISKEKELPEEVKKKSVAEYSFKKGIIAALFSGLMSAGMSFGLQSGTQMQKLAAEANTSDIWVGMPVLVVVLLGGFTVNAIWCLILNFKNGTTSDYFNFKTPVIANIIFAALAGAIWVMQFVCNKTGEPFMGDQAYVGWAVLMGSSILFSTLLGIFLGEWKGTGSRTKLLLTIGIIVLLGSAVMTGWSGKLKTPATATEPAIQEQTAPATTNNVAVSESVTEQIRAAEKAVKAEEPAAKEALSNMDTNFQKAGESITEQVKEAQKTLGEALKPAEKK